jgi:Family of unknown function (DUF6049)
VRAAARRHADGRATPRARTRVVLAGLAALLVTPLPGLLATPQAHAAGVPLGVSVSAVTITGAEPTSSVVVKGTVTNRSSGPVYGVTAGLWRSSDQLRTVAAITDAVAADHTPTGAVLHTVASETAALTAPTAALAPGASADFTVSATLADLEIPRDATYWFGARATGSNAPGGASSASLTGQGQTLATIPGSSPVNITTVIDLSATPRRLRPGLFSDDGLVAELAPGGRLSRLVDAAAQPGMSWAIDPSLLAEVTDMADGYAVSTPPTSTPGTGVDAAKGWLAAYRALPAASGVQTLYGHPDLVGAADAGATAVLDRAQAATAASGLGLPVVAVGARVNEASLASLGRRNIAVVTPDAGPTRPWALIGDAWVASAETFEAAVRSPLLGDSPATRAAVAVAMAWATGGQVRLVRTPDAAAIDAAAPAWVVRTPLRDLIATRPVAEAEAPPAAPASGGLTPELTGHLDDLATHLTAYGSAAPESALTPMVDALTSDAAGEAWLADPAGRASYIAAVQAVTALAGRITLSATRSVTLASATSQFPATITNHLADSITVKVVGESANGARMSIRSSEEVTIRPGESQTVLLTASAAGNGLVGADLSVQTPDGVRVSESVPISVEATSLGQIGWIVVVVAGVVLVVTTGLRIRQVRRRRSP